MEQLLIETIVKENDFTLITKLDENAKQHLKEHIQNSILDRYNYQPLEHIQEMIDEAVYFYEKKLKVINCIQTIKYTIDDKFYEKLKEDARLSRYTLRNFINISFIDGMDLIAERFEDIYKNFPHLEDYKQGIKNSLELHYKHKNRGKKVLEPLTKREINLITASMILAYSSGIRAGYRERIAKDYNINNNTPKTNQELLNNSYDVIIDMLRKLPNTDDIIDSLENEKSINNDLFTNAKRLSKLKTGNHYMSFLYKCASVYTENDLIAFQEFTEALISGNKQFLEFEDKKQKIKRYKQDLEVLKRYNTSNENDKTIQELEDKISFLSIPKPHQKFIPFKELANRLEIDTNKISNYITTILNNGTHKNTIKDIFDTLTTIPKEVCIGQF